MKEQPAMKKSADFPLLVVTADSVNPWHNLALEEYLMDLCQSDSDKDPERRYGAILYLWQNEHTVVIGRNQNAWAECRTRALERDGGRLARRSTGGGAVYHDLGNLNFSIILPRSRFDLGRNFDVILEAVRLLGIQAVRSGRNDILIGDRKFSGNAFRYWRGVALHHGTLMVDTRLEPLLRYLTVSELKLQSRAIKSVTSRVINLIEARSDLTIPALCDSVIDSFLAQYGKGTGVEIVDAGRIEGGEKLARLEEVYASWEWRYGNTIDFDARIETGRFPWGQAELLLKVEQGIISEAQIFSDALDSDFFRQIANSLPGTPFNSHHLADRIAGLGEVDETVGEISQKTIADDMGHVIREQSF
jgi:lipoate-protein ligase A